ncbi:MULTISPECIES: hypothetical protein [Methylobacterium]|uniref:Uncharacterized protein n=1 Tax=Methylobacterium ajmalii TaxID=2738439 RepID=A0ABU9ZV95_9HYPH|nr:hypothetical protein [Methylobacterium aquaticum]
MIVLLGVVIVWTPFLLLVLAMLLARLTGCEVNEARAHPCRVVGIDLGGTLYAMMMGWLLIPLMPFMVLTLLGGAIAGVAALVRPWRR